MSKTIAALAIVTVAEASIGIFVKLSGDAIPIFTLNFYRVLFAAGFLALALPFFNRDFLRYPKNNTRDVLIIGALLAAQISLYNIAMSLTNVASAVVFWSVAPFFVFIFSSLFLGERPKPIHIFVFALAIIGIAIAEPVAVGGELFSDENIGNVLALITGAVYAGLVTYLRSEGKTEAHIDIFWIMAAAAVYLSPAVFVFGPGNLLAPQSAPEIALAAPALVWVLGLGVVSTGVAYLFISLVLPKIDANVYSLVDVIVSPVIAAILAYFVLSEVPSANMAYGGAVLILSGFWLTRVMGRERSDVHEVARSVPGK